LSKKVGLPGVPDATVTVAHRGQTGVKIFVISAPNLLASDDQIGFCAHYFVLIFCWLYIVVWFFFQKYFTITYDNTKSYLKIIVTQC